MPEQRRGWALWLALGLTGCTPGCDGEFEADDTGEPTDDTIQDDVWSDDCASGIKGAPFPRDGQQDVYPRSTFVVGFITSESSTATFELRDADGVEVPLGPPTWSDDGMVAYFAPAEPLAPAKSYVLDVSFSCDGQREIAFTTSDVGGAADLDDVVASAFALDLASLRFVRPPGGNVLIDALRGELAARVVVSPRQKGEDGEVSLLTGVVDTDGTQDPCTPTLVLPAPLSLEENPYFEVEAPAGFTVEAGGVDVVIESLALSGAFAADGGALVGLALDLVVDTRTLGSLFEGLESDDPTAMCDVLEQVLSRSVCEPCRDAEPACLPVFAIDGTASRVDTPFAEVSDSDAAACETDPPSR